MIPSSLGQTKTLEYLIRLDGSRTAAACSGWLSLMFCGIEQRLETIGDSQPGLFKLILQFPYSCYIYFSVFSLRLWEGLFERPRWSQLCQRR